MRDIFIERLLLVLAGVMLAGASGCRTPLPTGHVDSDDANWKHFTNVASALEWSNSDNGGGYFHALETLGLTNWTFIHGPVLVAQGDRRKVMIQPVPDLWKADAQVLLASGNVTGDGQPKYILTAGWWGPLAGVLAVYDGHLKKLVELKMECIWGIELKDVTGDGVDEILCWEDEHHGSGFWMRWLTVVKYIEGRGLVVVWRGSTYYEVDKNLEISDIWIEQKKGQSARIWKKDIYRQHLEPGDRNGNRELIKGQPNELSSYVWNSATLRFEEDGAKIIEPDPGDDVRLAPRW